SLTADTSYLVQEPSVAARGIPLPAAMPRDQAGVGAVQQSQRERRLANSYNLDAVVVTAAPLADSLAAAPGERAGRSRRVGGRLFVWRDSAWTDIAHGASLRVVRVAAFSDAYFALLRALPELAQPAAPEPAVLVAGRRARIQIEAGGQKAGTRGGWLSIVPGNMARDEGRRAARGRRHLTLLTAEPQGSRSATDEALDVESGRARVRAALDELSPRDREVLLLWDAGLSYEEIAAQTGLARGAIGTTLSRARRRLVQANEAGKPGEHVARG